MRTLIIALVLVLVVGACSSNPKSASSAPTTTVAPTTTAPTTTVVPDPVQIVQDYVAALNAHDYGTAWNLGGRNLANGNGSGFGAYITSFHNVKRTDVTISAGGANGDAVAVTLTITSTDGTKTTYVGSYTVTYGVITDASLDKVTTVKPAPPTTRAKPKPKVVLEISGNGSHSHATRQFTVKDEWDLHWSYRASGAFSGQSVNFIVSAEDPDNSSASEPILNEIGTQGSGVEHLAAYGKQTIYLSVISEGSWTLKVIDVPEGCMLDTPPSC